MGIGTLGRGQGRSSGTAGAELWKLRPPASSTPGHALNPKPCPALFLSFLSCETGRVNSVITTTLSPLDQQFCLLCSTAKQNALWLPSPLLVGL